MVSKFLMIVILVGIVFCYPSDYTTEHFKFGIKYDGSVPLNAGSDRLRHRGNYDPFTVAVSTSAKNNHVIDYLEVSVTGDAGCDITFCVVRGHVGAQTIVFQVGTNSSDFIYYIYKTYGLPDNEYEKLTSSNYTGINGC